MSVSEEQPDYVGITEGGQVVLETPGGLQLSAPLDLAHHVKVIRFTEESPKHGVPDLPDGRG